MSGGTHRGYVYHMGVCNNLSVFDLTNTSRTRKISLTDVNEKSYLTGLTLSSPKQRDRVRGSSCALHSGEGRRHGSK